MKARPKFDSLALALVALLLGVQSLALLRWGTIPGIKLNLVFQLLLVISFFVWSARVSRSLLNAPAIFVGSIYFWHSTFLTPHFLSSAERFQETGNIFRVGARFIPEATALVGLCLVCAVVGTFYARNRLLLRNRGKGIKLASAGTVRLQRQFNGMARLWVWSILAVFVAIQAAYLISESRQIVSGNYLSLYTDEPDSLGYRLFQSLKFMGVPIILLVYATASNRIETRFALLISTAMIFLNLMLGSRSVPFIYGVALVVCIDRFSWRIRFFAMLALAIGASALSFTIDQSREFGLGLRVFDLSQTGRSIDYLHILSNAGGVIRNVLRTFEFSEGHFWWGRSFADSAIYLIPKAVLERIGMAPASLRPSDWLIACSPDVGPGEGLGYSLVAEAYLNFGYLGCLIFAFVGGVISHFFFSYCIRGDRVAWVNAYIVTVILCLHMRSDSATYLRAIVYGLLLTKLLQLLARRRRSVSLRRAAT